MPPTISTGQQNRMKHRRWIDVALIVVSVYALLAAVWTPPEIWSGGSADEVASTGGMLLTYTLGGLLGLAGFFLVHWNRTLGRILAFIGGLVILSGFLALSEVTLLAAISLGVTGLVMLVAGVLMGPMPTPEDEGQRRTGLGS